MCNFKNFPGVIGYPKLPLLRKRSGEFFAEAMTSNPQGSGKARKGNVAESWN
jgi:hypothetical protein